MLPLIDAAIRSLLVGAIVAIGLRAFGIQNVFARKAALGLVLVGALGMPLVMPVTARLPILPATATLAVPAQAMTLLEELQAKLLVKSGQSEGYTAPAAPVQTAHPPRSETAPAKQAEPGVTVFKQEPGWPATGSDPADLRASAAYPQGGAHGKPAPHRDRFVFSLSRLVSTLYIGVAGFLMLRLLLGLAVTLRLWRHARPVSTQALFEIPEGLRVRASRSVRSPLTIGSGIVLPADYESWDQEKFEIVLAHEQSHIRQGDFYLQTLAGVYAALVWFSPLGWWLKRELADLSEAISDRAGIEQARSRTSYAQILLEFAAAPRPAAMGVAMARQGRLTRRIERLLNEQVFRQSFGASRGRTLFAVALVPVVMFAATAVVGVQAAAHAASHAGGAAVSSAQTSAKPSAARYPELTPAERVEVQDGEGSSALVTAISDKDAIETEQPDAGTAEIASLQAGQAELHFSAAARAVTAGAESRDPHSFDRTFQVSGDAQLFVMTGSGNIQLKRGSGSQIHVHGRIHVNDDGDEEQARAIAANPPMEQSGNVIRIGQDHENHWHGISIDYEIEAPASTLLAATSGSGDIVDEGVGRNAKLETGSGDIQAKGLEGAFIVKTGSGNVTADGTGEGDVKAETGSGNIEIRNVHGGFRGHTGSGDIKATGTPSSPWELQTGSGSVEIWTGNAPMTLDASTGSGSFETDHEMLMKGSFNQHHVTGNLNGGGPVVRVQTGSGDVRVH